MYDVAIIGGGPAGYNAAGKAAANGLKVVVFEKSAIGGVCLNEGCIPTKTLLYSAKTFDQIKTSSKYGVSVGGEVSFDLKRIVARKNKTVRKLTIGIRNGLTEQGVTIVMGEAVVEKDTGNSLIIASEGEKYEAAHLLLCTGSETIVPPIKGLSETEYWTSKEALDVKELPERLVIIGGGVIGIEFASFFNSMGVKVEVVEMMPEILGVMDKETSAMLRAEYAKRGIVFHLETKVTAVSPTAVTVEKEGETLEIAADRVLLSVGRRPVLTGFGLEGLNLEKFRNGLKVNEQMQTSNPRIFACGDITGFSLLAHTAIREGEVAIQTILGKEDAMSYRAIPSVVYTNPEIAGVGKTEEELTAAGTPHTVKKLPMAFSGRFVAENEGVNGLCKLILDKEERVVGCHMLGNPCSEIMVTAGLAIEQNLTVEAFAKLVFPHPTVGEIIHECLN